MLLFYFRVNLTDDVQKVFINNFYKKTSVLFLINNESYTRFKYLNFAIDN